MQTHSEILVWRACNFEKRLKTGFGSVGDVYYKSSKNQTKSDFKKTAITLKIRNFSRNELKNWI